MLTNLFFLAAGIALLVKGADYLIDGSTAIARRLRVSTLVIGLTVVAFGTSTPELAVNLLAAASGATDVALGNINGSNIANILLILGIVTLVANVPVRSRTVVKEIPFMLLAGMMLLILSLDAAIDRSPDMLLSRTDGLALLGFFSIFVYYMYLSAADVTTAKVERPKYGPWVAMGYSLMGLGGLILGGKLTVDGAVGIATVIGVSEAMIAVTVVAIGTSLPELVTSIVAARKGQMDLAVGNVVGSNIVNILFVIALTAVVSPTAVVVSNAAIWDSFVAFASMVVLFVALFARSSDNEGSRVLARREGVVFLMLYAAYIVYIVVRG